MRVRILLVARGIPSLHTLRTLSLLLPFQYLVAALRQHYASQRRFPSSFVYLVRLQLRNLYLSPFDEVVLELLPYCQILDLDLQLLLYPGSPSRSIPLRMQ